jgi:hypothetical protein
MPTDEIKPIKPMVGFIRFLKNPNPKKHALPSLFQGQLPNSVEIGEML